MMKTDWQSDTEQLRRFFSSINHLPALIIDIRGNTGGNSQYWSTNLVWALGGPKMRPETAFFVMRTKLVEDLQRLVGETKQQFALRAGSLKNNIPQEIWGSSFSTPEVSGWTSDYSPAKFSFDGKVYVLTSRASASESFAAYCKASLDPLDKNGFPAGPMPICDTTLRTCLDLIVGE